MLMRDDYIQRLEAALSARSGQPVKTLFNVPCAACGTNIPHYSGPEKGILCQACYVPNDHVLLNCGNLVPENFEGCRDYEIED